MAQFKITDGKCVVPYGVTEIEAGAFFYCEHLASVCIPDSVKEIGSQAFEGCSKLKAIRIPASVVSIESSSFASCRALESIEVDEANPAYRSESNTLLSKDGKTLVLGCKTSVIPESVTTIADYAFCGSRMKQIDIPERVTAIGDLAFEDCVELKKIVIPKNVNEWGHHVFYGCSKLKEIVFLCPMEGEWNYIFFGCDFTDLYLSYGPERYGALPESLLESCVEPKTVALHVPEDAESAYRQHPFYSKFCFAKSISWKV